MKDAKAMEAKLTIDIKRCRFRIHQNTLKGIGSPTYIQFLVNPENGYIAILGLDKPLSGGTANRVQLCKSAEKFTTEFYSAHLMNKIFNLFGTMDFQYSYWLSGEIDHVNRVAYFSMKTLKRVERKHSDGRQRV